MIAGFELYFIALLLIRLRGEILRRERNAHWIAEELGEAPLNSGQSGPSIGSDYGDSPAHPATRRVWAP